jgi:hypothetical protein
MYLGLAFLYEQEERSYIWGWQPLSWTTLDGTPSLRDTFACPPSCEWAGSWQPFTSQSDTDEEGWSYGTSSRATVFTREEDFLNRPYRRRIWKRTYRSPIPLDKSPDDGTQKDPVHLIVLLHGWIGSTEDVKNIKAALHASFVEPVIIYSVKGNEGKTTDGVIFGGVKAAQEVIEQLTLFPSIKRLSCIGHSLGGLYARYMISVLDDQGVFSRVQPVCYISLATPHLGSCHFSNMASSYSFGFIKSNTTNSIANVILGETGRHLFLSDCDNGEGQSDIKVVQEKHEKTSLRTPLLVQMSTPKFTKSLARFELLAAYANIQGDTAVGYYSASINGRLRNPYDSLLLTKETLPTLPNFPTILDRAQINSSYPSLFTLPTSPKISPSSNPEPSSGLRPDQTLRTLRAMPSRAGILTAGSDVRDAARTLKQKEPQQVPCSSLAADLAMVVDTVCDPATRENAVGQSKICGPYSSSLDSKQEEDWEIVSSPGFQVGDSKSVSGSGPDSQKILPAITITPVQASVKTSEAPAMPGSPAPSGSHASIDPLAMVSRLFPQLPGTVSTLSPSGPSTTANSNAQLLDEERYSAHELEMTDNLNKLPWQKFDVVGRPLIAHVDIVWKNTWANAPGENIIKHVIGLLNTHMATRERDRVPALSANDIASVDSTEPSSLGAADNKGDEVIPQQANSVGKALKPHDHGKTRRKISGSPLRLPPGAGPPRLTTAALAGTPRVFHTEREASEILSGFPEIVSQAEPRDLSLDTDEAAMATLAVAGDKSAR